MPRRGANEHPAGTAWVKRNPRVVKSRSFLRKALVIQAAFLVAEVAGVVRTRRRRRLD